MASLNSSYLLLSILLLYINSSSSLSSSSSSDKCTVPAASSCEKLESNVCLGAQLNYGHTYPYFWNETQPSIHEYLNATFSSVKKVPRCWSLLESLLCPLFFPKCDESSNRITLPSHEVCRNVNTSCKLIEPILRSICSNATLFSTDCDNKKDIIVNKFTNQLPHEKCYNPVFVMSEDEKTWVPGTDCAFNCTDLRFPPENREELSNFIFNGSLITSAVLALAVCSWIIDWKRVSRFPSDLTFHLCTCLLFVNVMFLHQFVMTKREIVCRSDWTIRSALPSKNDQFYCLVSFVPLYYFSTAALIWLMIIAISWANYFSLKSSSKSQSEGTWIILRYLTNYPHLFAYCLAGIFIIIVWATNAIDGSYLLGICYVGMNNWSQRIWLSLVPILISALVSEYYFALCIKNLFISKQSLTKSLEQTDDKETNSPHYCKQKTKISVINRAMFNIFILMAAVFVSLVVVIWANVTEYNKKAIWQENLTNQVNCLFNLSDITLPKSVVAKVNNPYKCYRNEDDSLQYKEPDLYHIYLQLTCLFAISIATASWTWTRATLMSWRRLVLRCMKADEVTMHYNKVNMEALHDRKGPYHRVPTDNNFNCAAIALPDPICMNLTSHEMSNTSNHADRVVQQLEMMQSSNSKSRMKRKKWFKKHSAYDASSISEGSFCRSQNASSFKESIELGSVRNSQISLQDMNELKETVRRQRRKTRSFPHKFAHRHSDTSTQSLASNAFIAGKPGLIPLPPRGVSQSTSTGDLQIRTDHQFLLMQQQTHNQQMLQQNIAHTSPIFNFSATIDLFGEKNQNFGHNLCHSNVKAVDPLAPPSIWPNLTQSQVFNEGRIELLKKNINPEDLVFSHGEIAHGKKLLDPFKEKRRPDAEIPYHTPSIFPSIDMTCLHQNSALSVNNQSCNMVNLVLSTQNTFGINGLAQPSFQPFAPRGTAIGNFGHMISNQGANVNSFINPMANIGTNQTTNHHHLIPSTAGTVVNHQMFHPTMSPSAIFVPNVQPCQTLEELQTIVRERAQLLPICTQLPSDSEVDNSAFPIFISESEACLTDGGSFQESNLSRDKASDNSNLMIQQEVTERIKKLEKAAEQNEQQKKEENSAGDLNGDLSNNNNNNNESNGVSVAGKQGKKFHLNDSTRTNNDKSTPRPHSLEEPNKRTRKKAFKKHYKK